MIELPVCRWRREQTAADRHACVSPKLLTGPLGVLDSKCSTCYCRDHPPPQRRGGTCLHLGKRLFVTRCGPCSQKAGRPVMLPVHSCEVHDKCTISIAHPKLKCCKSCPDFLPDWERPTAGAVRHLTYHIYPITDVWRWNVEQLVRRMSLFNGRRLVSVATGKGTASFNEVKAAFGGQVLELREVPNDPVNKELASFPALVREMSEYRSPADVTFYGHAKGVTSEKWGPGVRRWTTAMYETLLDYWPAVARELQTYCITGIYRRLRCGVPGSLARWHYSGSFRWTRNRDLYSRDWEKIDPGWCGGESYPGLHFAPEECSCLHGEFGAGGLGLYLDATWQQWAAESHATWCAQHIADKQEPLLLTCILTAHNQPELVHEAIASVRAQTADSWQLLIVDSGALSRAGAYARYASDARITIIETNETEEQRRSIGIQSWAINEAWRRGLVRGDLICHLCDDDVYDPGAFAAWIGAARARPDQLAWFSPALRVQYQTDGSELRRNVLDAPEVAGQGRSLDCVIDGMQLCHRRAVREDWPEERIHAPHADGVWMDRIGGKCLIHRVGRVCGRHRHTARSSFTQRG